MICFRSGDDSDCDTCKKEVMAFGQLLVSDDAANEAVTMLQGNILNFTLLVRA